MTTETVACPVNWRRYQEPKHVWRWDRARCEMCGIEAHEYVAQLEKTIVGHEVAWKIVCNRLETLEEQKETLQKRLETEMATAFLLSDRVVRSETLVSRLRFIIQRIGRRLKNPDDERL